MPEGLPKLLGPDRLRDLMTFLLTEPPHMPATTRGKPPPPRTRAEVRAVLAGAPSPPEKTRPIRVVLVAGRKDHGPGEHDYPAWQKAWKELLAAADDIDRRTAWDWPTADDLKTADVLVFYQQGTWTPDRARDMDAFLDRGGGLVYVHYAVDGGTDAPGFAQRIGLAWQGGRSKFRHGPLELGFETGDRHPIGRNFGKVKFTTRATGSSSATRRRCDVLATRRRGREAAAAVLDAGAGEGAGVRVDPRPLLVDVRRPAVPRPAPARHRLDGPRAGGPVQRPGLAGGERPRLNIPQSASTGYAGGRAPTEDPYTSSHFRGDPPAR